MFGDYGCVLLVSFSVCFFKQKTAYELRISDWSSDVCSSDLWSNGDKVTAEAVAAILRSYLGRRSKHVLKDDFPEVETIKAMTDTVIEIRLSVPQPNLLELLAQPAMAIVNRGMGDRKSTRLNSSH